MESTISFGNWDRGLGRGICFRMDDSTAALMTYILEPRICTGEVDTTHHVPLVKRSKAKEHKTSDWRLSKSIPILGLMPRYI